MSVVANSPVEVFCAGRTDAGVHGTGQVVHFETQANRPLQSWCFGTNAHLPDDIAVKWAVAVNEDFHARFSATARRYRYIIFNQKLRSAILPKGVTHFHFPLDERKNAPKQGSICWARMTFPLSVPPNANLIRRGGIFII